MARVALGTLLGLAMALSVGSVGVVVAQSEAVVPPSADAQVFQLLDEALNSRFKLGATSSEVRLRSGERLDRPLRACNRGAPGEAGAAIACVRIGMALDRTGAGSGESMYARGCGLGSTVGCVLWANALRRDGFPDLAEKARPPAEWVASIDVRDCERGVDAACGMNANLVALTAGLPLRSRDRGVPKFCVSDSGMDATPYAGDCSSR